MHTIPTEFALGQSHLFEGSLLQLFKDLHSAIGSPLRARGVVCCCHLSFPLFPLSLSLLPLPAAEPINLGEGHPLSFFCQHLS